LTAYIASAQVIGGIVAAAILYVIASGEPVSIWLLDSPQTGTVSTRL
jgi:glycerol uptake facilitator-like aquaporin